MIDPAKNQIGDRLDDTIGVRQKKGPFVGGVISLHIQRRIAFRKTQLLCQQQSLMEI